MGSCSQFLKLYPANSLAHWSENKTQINALAVTNKLYGRHGPAVIILCIQHLLRPAMNAAVVEAK